MQSNKSKKITLSFIYTKGKSFSVADMLSRSFFQEELQLNHVKHKQTVTSASSFCNTDL